MATLDLQEVLDFAIALSKKAGEAIARGSEERFATDAGFDEKKNTADLVTETDQNTEKLVLGEIRAKYPDHKFIGEESWAAGDQGAVTHEPTWVVDPIDGTTNFCKGFPYVCISIGFVYNSQPTIGVLYAPFLGYLYYARQGHGAYMCSPMHPEPRQLPLNKPQPLPTFKQALIAFEWGSDRSPAVLDCKTRTYKRLVGDGSAGIDGGLMALGVRSLGSAALNFAHVAMGCLDLYWEIGCWAWDVCAGIVIAEEAGCAVVGSKDMTRIALASPTSFGNNVPPEVLTGRKYVVVRKIANTPNESGSNAQKRIIGQFYDAVEEWDP